jgi:N6-adenosine-specific RNA methylase IME4
MEREIEIDAEFQALMSPLSEEERSGLERALLQDGCRDPLVVWAQADGAPILLDGHNRYETCQRRGLAYSIKSLDLASREEAMVWICENQLNRRNLNETQRAMIAAKMANMKQGARTDLLPIGGMSQAQAAKVMRVGERSVQRACKVLQSGSPKLIEASQRGIIPVSRSAEIAELSKEEQDRIAERCLKRGDAKPAAHDASILRKTKKGNPSSQERTNDFEGAPQFAIVLADPWNGTQRPADTQTGVDHRPHSLKSSQTKALSEAIAQHLQPDAVVFLWSPISSPAEAIDLMKAWGFSYRSNMVSVEEPRSGVDDAYLRIEHQLLIIGTRGNAPLPPVRPSSILSCTACEVIDQMFPDLLKLALDTQVDRPGWRSLNDESAARKPAKFEQINSTSAPDREGPALSTAPGSIAINLD